MRSIEIELISSPQHLCGFVQRIRALSERLHESAGVVYEKLSGRTDISISGMRVGELDVSRSARKKWDHVPPPSPHPIRRLLIFSACKVCLFSRKHTVQSSTARVQKNLFFVGGRPRDYVRIASTRLKSWDGGRRQRQNLVHLRQAAMNARRTNKSHKARDRRRMSRTLLTTRPRSPTSSYGQLNPPLQSIPSDQMTGPISRLTARGTSSDTLRRIMTQRTRSWTCVRARSRA